MGEAARSWTRRSCARVCRQAIGAVFKDDTVMSGMNELSKESWRTVARHNDLPIPNDDYLELALGAPPAPLPACPHPLTRTTALPAAPGREAPPTPGDAPQGQGQGQG